MKNPVLGVLATLGLALLGPLVAAAPAPETSRRIASFQLPDQFGTLHSVAFPGKRPLLLLVADRRGSEEIDPWIQPLMQRWSQIADIVGIADVRAAPRFLRGRITEAIRESRPKPILLDFEGKATESLPLKKKTANLFVVAPDGRIVAHVSGPCPPTPDSTPEWKELARALSTFPPTTRTAQ